MFDVHYFNMDKIMKWVCRIVPAILAAIAIFVAIYGCASTTMEPGRLRSFDIAKTPQDDLECKFQEVIDYCIPRLQEYERKANVQASKAFWMNMSGLLSGAVAAPMIIASGSTGMWPLMIVAGLSGWAGATPFASDVLRISGLSGESVARMRNEIVERIRDKAGIALDGTRSYDERRNAIMGIVGECTIYPMVVPSVEVQR